MGLFGSQRLQQLRLQQPLLLLLAAGASAALQRWLCAALPASLRMNLIRLAKYDARAPTNSFLSLSCTKRWYITHRVKGHKHRNIDVPVQYEGEALKQSQYYGTLET